MVTIGSELAFTLYVHAYGFSNLVGHVLKIVSFYLIYKAVVETGLRQPYSLLFRELKEREENLRVSEHRYRNLFENASVGIVTLGLDGTITAANPSAAQILGYDRIDEMVGKRDTDMWVDDSDRTKEMQQTLLMGYLLPLEVALRRRDGTPVWVLASATIGRASEGEVQDITIMFTDVTERRRQEHELRTYREHLEELVETRTSELVKAKERLEEQIEERKRAEANVREAELRYRTVADSTYDWVYWEFPDGTLRYVSPSCQRVTGYTVDDFLENSALLHDIVVPEDAKIWAAHHHDPVAPVALSPIQFRIRRRDGEVRWIEHVCQPVTGDANAFLGYRVSNRDVTARKRAEEALRESEDALRKSHEEYRVLAQRLLTVQEAERRRLAREMHDDLTQRLAVMAIEVGKLERDLHDSPPLVTERLAAMREDMVKLSADIHAISRQLHPSILDDLGLTDAIKSKCLTFSQQEGYVVRYEPVDIPETVPKDVALCIYRVIQEGLQNVAKHTNATEIRISLKGENRRLRLTIEDNGEGFNVDDPGRREGLGLLSMKERVNLIRGVFSIESTLGKGTVIRVEAPLVTSD
jgi:PAS domain S-box-containing protein